MEEAMRQMGLMVPTFDDSDVELCKYCGGTPALFAGLMTCECGAVLGRILDSAPEPTRDGSKERHCAPVSALYPCATTYVSARTSASRKAVKMQAWTGQANARNLVKNLTTLVAEASELGLCDAVTTRAKHIYVDVAKDPHLRGTRRAGLIEGCIYAALQSQGCARTVEEMSSKEPGRVISRGIKRVMRSVASKEATTAPCSSRAYLARHRQEVLKALVGPADAEGHADAASVAAELVDELGIACRFKPPSKAAACVIMTAGRSVDRGAVSKALGISECTATRCLAAMAPFRTAVLDVVSSRVGSWRRPDSSPSPGESGS
jgi:transcription initiation factor TFIIIB Brf1 subunit/transcription initiation factor TFIIB